jgi:hypothetical protein
MGRAFDHVEVVAQRRSVHAQVFQQLFGNLFGFVILTRLFAQVAHSLKFSVVRIVMLIYARKHSEDIPSVA